MAVRTIVGDWAKGWSDHNAENLLALFTEDCIYEDVTMGVVNHGKGELKSFIERMLGESLGLKIALISEFSTGQWAGAEWTMSATSSDKKPFSVRGSSIIELRDGKIARLSDYWDLSTVMEQVNAKS
ncbi:MAG: nuclear transport factor 2 family protein [Methylophilaceae bacterium]